MPKLERASTPRRRRPDSIKPAKRGTPIRNGLLLLIFAVMITVMVIILPSEPANHPATVLAPEGEAAVEAGQPADLPLRITEIMSSNKHGYPDERGLYSDWVEIHNISDAPVSLKGVGLSDRGDRIKFLFPEMELEAGGYIVVFCDGTNKTDPKEPFHARFHLSALGETVYLYDPNGMVFDSAEAPPLYSDAGYALAKDGWAVTERITPGYPNDEAGYEAFRSSFVASANGLVLSEICAANRTLLTDEDGENSDWIEIYNGGSVPVDLSYFALSNNEAKPLKWRFPPGSVVQPNEFYVVFASGKDRPGGEGNLPHTNFGLAAEGKTVLLSDFLGRTVDRITYDNLGKDESYGRVPGDFSTWEVFRQPTPGLPNTRQGAMEMDRRMRARNESGVFISEVATACMGLQTPFGPMSYDWIELFNASKEPVDLTNWGLSDDVGRPRKWQFPEETIVEPGEYLLVFASGLTQRPPGETDTLHAGFSLSSQGEAVVFCDPRGHVLDKLVVPRLAINNSYGRDFDQGGLFYYEKPTAGKRNTAQGYLGYAGQPVIETKSGLITRPTAVTISAPADVAVRYTLDGAEPAGGVGQAYTGPIIVPDSAVVRARGFREGYIPSEIVTKTYLFNAYHILPIIAVTVDPDDLWDPLTGIYADGDGDTFEVHPFQKATYYQINKTRAMRERPGYFELFSAEGEPILDQGAAIQLHGNFSLDLAQKSFRITAKPKYGSFSFAYPFFDDRPYGEYRGLILRNGGVEGSYTRIVDALTAKIVDWTDSTLLTMASTPVIVYLNGAYWGQYEIRERINKYHVAMAEGWSDPEDMDFIKANNTVLSGSFDNYRALFHFISGNDLSNPAAFETLMNWIDMTNYLDFMIFETYFGNTDTLNIKFYRQHRPDAKWRWIFFDLDWGFWQRDTNGFKTWLKEEGTGPMNGDGWLIRAILRSPQGKDMFLRRYGELWPYLTDADRIIALIDEMVTEMEPEMGLHFNRWAGQTRPAVAIDPYLARDNAIGYWRSRINRLKNIVRGRPYYVWTQAKEWFSLTDEEMLAYFGPCPARTEDIY